MEVLAVTDGLTRLKNRRAIQEQLQEEVGRVARYPASLSSMLLGVDHFKQFNDTFGHPIAVNRRPDDGIGYLPSPVGEIASSRTRFRRSATAGRSAGSLLRWA